MIILPFEMSGDPLNKYGVETVYIPVQWIQFSVNKVMLGVRSHKKFGSMSANM